MINLLTDKFDLQVAGDDNNEQRNYRFANGLQIESGRLTSNTDMSENKNFVRSFSERPIMVCSWRWADFDWGKCSATPSSNSTFTVFLSGDQEGLRGCSYIAYGKWK